MRTSTEIEELIPDERQAVTAAGGSGAVCLRRRLVPEPALVRRNRPGTVGITFPSPRTRARSARTHRGRRPGIKSRSAYALVSG